MKTFALAGVALMLVLAGCGDDDDASEESSEPSSEESSESVELPAEAADVLAAYNEATAVDHDGDAMLAVVTEDFTFLSVGDTVLDRDAYAAEVDSYLEGFTVETLGDEVVVGGGNTYIVSEPNTASAGGLDTTGFSVFRIVESDGEWLVDAHRFTGD
jgi:hypothetical protein